MNEPYEDLRKLSPGRIAHRIKEYRERQGITQETLANRLGIKRWTLIRWEKAKVRVSNIMLRMLIDAGVLG